MKDNTSNNQSYDNINSVDGKSKYKSNICGITGMRLIGTIEFSLLINRETSKCSFIYELHKITIHS